MEYEEIKLHESYDVNSIEIKVISKSDEYKIITTIDTEGRIGLFGPDFSNLKPLQKELPEEGLLVSKGGSLYYRTGEHSGYGFVFGKQERYDVTEDEPFHLGTWKPATPEQETKFVEMLKKECESRGLFEDTKIEAHVDIKDCDLLNKFSYEVGGNVKQLWNIHGQIFYKGKFATPLKTSLLDKVTFLANEFGSFSVEETPTGVIVISPLGE